MFHKGKKLKGPIRSNSDLQGLAPLVRRELAGRLPQGATKVLDVGTGFGGNVEFLTRSLSSRSRIWTLDPSSAALANAKKVLGVWQSGPKVEFIQTTADRIDVRDGFFDFIVSVMTLHHIDYLESAVAEMLRVLDRRGTLLLIDFTPEAATKFHFRVHHRKSDFFALSQVSAALEHEGAIVKAYDHGSWYLLEGTKPPTEGKHEGTVCNNSSAQNANRRPPRRASRA